MFKVVVSNTRETIGIADLEELKNVLRLINTPNMRTIICTGGVFNPSFYVCVVEDKEAERQATELERLGRKIDKSTSPFAQLLAPQKKMISNGEKTKVAEEVAKEERKLK